MNVPVNEIGDEILHDDDSDVRQLLEEAYDVPPIPRSLRKRIDQQWKLSAPGADVPLQPVWLSHVAGLSRFVAGKAVWRVGVCAVVMVGLMVALQTSGTAYGWATVFRALSRQPVVQVEQSSEETSQHYFSVREGVWLQRTDQLNRLVDTDQKYVLAQNPGLPIVRYGLEESQSEPEYLVMRSLTGVDVRPDFVVADESWSRGANGVELTFAVQDSVQRFNVALTLNPKTHLPMTANVFEHGQPVRMLSYRYPTVSPADLVAQVLPEFSDPVESSVARSEFATALNEEIVAIAPSVAPASANHSQESLKRGAASLGWEPIAPVSLTQQLAVEEIDLTLQELWSSQGVQPVEPAREEELLRRVYLDLTGRTPTVMEVRRYLDDPSPQRYQNLVERLLDSRDHATHLATVWRNFLLPEGVDLSKFGGVTAFDEWLGDKFEAQTPYDQLVRELLLAEGRLSKSGPLLFYSSLKLDADQLAARTARVFLGMRLDCAQCHDDPFEPWTQDDFWSYAAFFAQISRPQAELEAVSTVMRVRDTDHGEVMMPYSDEPVAPRFLDGREFDAQSVRRRELARWLTSAENPYFARAAANRVWALMFGKGIVDPVDGFGKSNPATSPELLDHLASYFIAQDFSLSELFQAIALSDAYQLSSGAPTANPRRLELFAQMNVKTLSAEQVYDCITVATLFEQAPASGYFIDRIGNSARDEFLAQFKTSAGKMTEYQGGIPQALTLMNGSLISGATGLSSSGLLKSLAAPFFTNEQRIEILYLATLSRKPTENEWEILRDYVSNRDERVPLQEPLADILWALLNSAEFTMNH